MHLSMCGTACQTELREQQASQYAPWCPSFSTQEQYGAMHLDGQGRILAGEQHDVRSRVYTGQCLNHGVRRIDSDAPCLDELLIRIFSSSTYEISFKPSKHNA